MARIDLSGRQFGHLEVTDYSHSNGGKVFWNVVCLLCGTKVVKAAQLLLSYRIRSCGCLKRERSTQRDLSSERFGRLVVIKSLGKSWLVRCDCGVEKQATYSNLIRGRSRSCGCLRKEKSTIHGMAGAQTKAWYTRWHSMRSRCENPNHKSFSDYGERGIYVCDEWQDVRVFVDWCIENCPNVEDKSLSIDRIDNDGPYAPWNCRFATKCDQNLNRRKSDRGGDVA